MHPTFFDIHSHLDFPDYDEDKSEVLERLKETDTYTITVGTDPESSARAIALAEENEGIYACIGVHPVDKPLREFDKGLYQKLASHPKVVAIGECGLDFFHKKKEDDFKRQEQLFLDQIQLALEEDKPIMIHARNSYDEILDILEPLKREHGERLRGNAHFFAGSLNQARRFLDIDFTISFTGVITFTRDYDEVIKFAPLEMIHAETDSPFVAPVPYRGKRNEPSYVSEVAKTLAHVRGESFEVVQKALIENACRVFKIVLK
jgi:TatD DNase family protein